MGSGAESAVPVLVEALLFRNLNLRQAAARALGAIRSHPELSVPALIGCFHQKDGRIQRLAVEALSAFGVEAIASMIRLIKTQGRMLRNLAFRVLRRIGAAAVAELALLLKSPRVEICIPAAEMLREIGPAAAAALSELRKLLKASERSVRTAAKKAIAKIEPAN